MPSITQYWLYFEFAAGKYILLEKSSSGSADEMRRMFEFAREKNLVLFEAFHYRYFVISLTHLKIAVRNAAFPEESFHPTIQRTVQIIDSGKLGQAKSVTGMLALRGLMPDDDIRFQFDLSGCRMDMGGTMRYLLKAEPLSIESPPPHCTT
ncbi:hypothetical protein BOTBODRAFT_240266 [Botryobasidium botryosum FD-172 SS1]|uniref:Uncharacterized protein n=1 Tax=Botryobasidium botryosum (strain FD-172 SS1) TaxID=930990 RepID=A0A067MM09_BOTB1|nr:hypothetical protein BOTBODRAFT_240266 [Botryobasidium botryosum FD-172 SS1]